MSPSLSGQWPSSFSLLLLPSCLTSSSSILLSYFFLPLPVLLPPSPLFHSSLPFPRSAAFLYQCFFHSTACIFPSLSTCCCLLWCAPASSVLLLPPSLLNPQLLLLSIHNLKVVVNLSHEIGQSTYFNSVYLSVTKALSVIYFWCFIPLLSAYVTSDKLPRQQR